MTGYRCGGWCGIDDVKGMRLACAMRKEVRMVHESEWSTLIACGARNRWTETLMACLDEGGKEGE